MHQQHPSRQSEDDYRNSYDYHYYKKRHHHSKAAEEQKVADLGFDEGEESIYDQPTLPYYVVPVLYVPKRVLPNEEVQKASSKYSRKNIYKDNGYFYEGGDVEDQSYYNMQYTGSSCSAKDDLYTSYASTTAHGKKVAVKPLKSQSYDTGRIKVKSKSAYECSRSDPYYYYEATKHHSSQISQYHYMQNEAQEINYEVVGTFSEKGTQTTATKVEMIGTQTAIDDELENLQKIIEDGLKQTLQQKEKKSTIPTSKHKNTVEIENFYSDEENNKEMFRESRRPSSAKRRGYDDPRLPSPPRRQAQHNS